MDYLDRYADQLDTHRIRALRAEADRVMDRPYARRFSALLNGIHRRPAEYLSIGKDLVTVGKTTELTPDEQQRLKALLVALIPWRKGPFNFYGNLVDGEWRSDVKWRRLQKLASPALSGRRVLDIGANNLYYLYRIAAEAPEIAVGVDPVTRYRFHAALQQRLAPQLPIAFEPFGLEDLPPYDGFFDTVFCLGIIYHRRDPMRMLEEVHRLLRPGGELYLEGITIEGKGSYAVFPEERYMKAKGYWFLPTAEALTNMVRRSPFGEVEFLGEFPLTPEEQRRTEWSMYESLENFLDPRNPSRTIEGYPAPRRAFLRARRRCTPPAAAPYSPWPRENPRSPSKR